MAFKKSMEQQHGDEIDELFNFSGQEELDFDPDELDNLEMLEVKNETSNHKEETSIAPALYNI